MVEFRKIFVRMVRLRNLFLMIILTSLLYMLKSHNAPKTMKIAEDSKVFVPRSLKKIDWHNYTQINYEKTRVGTGEQGLPAYLSLDDDVYLEERLYTENGFNAELSDKIPLNRSLPDIRHPGCASRLYIETLPKVSVVIPFHNEHWTSLLRTIYSVLYRSPPQLIKEIFLVDDASTKDILKKKLDHYLAKNMPKVKVLRLKTRGGLITARLAGAEKATADVLIFLDSHTEANVNWLPPLLEPIALNYRTAVCPLIDVIAYDTFQYRALDEGARGTFSWELFYKRIPVLPKDEKNMPLPFETPVMAGGLFAISRAFFRELGGYDPGLSIWEGEQYELSFKIWQCGGRILESPCSRVGHIYRKFAPYHNPNREEYVAKNHRRVAEVWMDEYIQYLYLRRPHYMSTDPGDLTKQKALRKKLGCKPFKWFMTQIAFDLTYYYPLIDPNPYAQGHIKPLWNRKLCIKAKSHNYMEPLILSTCKKQSLEDKFVFTWYKDIRLKMNNNMCWDLPSSVPRSKVVLYSCYLAGGNQLWRYHLDTKYITHGTDCLDYDHDSHDLFINRCDENSVTQQWIVDHIDFEAMRGWDAERVPPTGPTQEQ